MGKMPMTRKDTAKMAVLRAGAWREKISSADEISPPFTFRERADNGV